MSVDQTSLAEQYGITTDKPLQVNLGYDELFAAETGPDVAQVDKAVVSSLGAVAIDTGRFTGRSPKDKYFVEDPDTVRNLWWHEQGKQGADNKPMTSKVWRSLKDMCVSQLSDKPLYVMEGFCGATTKHRLKVRLITEVAWMAHFFKNMFIRPSDQELENFEPDWTILNACNASCRYFKEMGMHSEVFTAFNVSEKMTIIGGTRYGGEIKKGIFTMMNYFLPLKGVGAFHCSANKGADGDTAMFFGLSGTGKTTLSTDPERSLIGDDEHGWDEEGIFNFEGGCYAKMLDLSEESEPEIYAAIRRDALLENVVIDDKGIIDCHDKTKTSNTRVSYPIYHIDNHVSPISSGTHPHVIVFLTCDAFGVLPPVSKLTYEQAMYQFVSGYTAKVAGTEIGVTEPTAVFSACYGGPFLALHPIDYAKILGEKIKKHDTRCYLVNTGWSGGAYGEGKRMSLSITRDIIHRILSGEIDGYDTKALPYFDLAIPQIDAEYKKCLNPRDTWADGAAYDAALKKLATMFCDNFSKNLAAEHCDWLQAYGPKL